MGIDYDDDDDLLDDEQPRDNNVMKTLRSKAKADAKRIAELEKQLQELSSANRSRSVIDVLSSKGLSNAAKVAKLIPADVDPSEEGIGKWLDEYGDVFGLGASANDTPVVPDKDIAALNKMDAAVQAGQDPTGVADLAARIAATQSIEELNALLASVGRA